MYSNNKNNYCFDKVKLIHLEKNLEGKTGVISIVVSFIE